MNNVKKIWLNPKITRMELSTIYKEIKSLNLTTTWLDVLRKSSRANVVVKFKLLNGKQHKRQNTWMI